MKKRKMRISFWLAVIVVLFGVAVYSYLDRNDISPFNKGNETNNKPKELIYQNPTDGSLVSHNLLNNSEVTILEKDFGELVSISPDLDLAVAILLVKKNKRYSLQTLCLVNGSQTILVDLTDFTPKAVYRFHDNRFLLINGDNSDNIIFLDESYDEVSKYNTGGEVTAVYSKSEKKIEYAVFDGNKSDIMSLDLDGLKATKLDSVIGRVYRIAEDKILYASKEKMASDAESNPVEKSVWKIAIRNRIDKTDDILSEGNFDQNAVSDDSFQYIAYQKKTDIKDEPDGRIFLLGPDNRSDRLNIGIPLIYSYQ